MKLLQPLLQTVITLLFGNAADAQQTAGTQQTAENCPSQLRRLSPHHSYCLTPRPTCNVIWQGMMEDHKDEIVNEHNRLRAKLAQGQQDNLPAAANMVEMVWDPTLEVIAQKWAEQCNFHHDCNNCRAVPDYGVGQNLGLASGHCETPNCAADSWTNLKPNWTEIVNAWYDEVYLVDPSVVQTFAFSESYGHFTQVAWAESWRVGCGYVAYQEGGKYLKQLYACNYGVAGNTMGEQIYDIGTACSTCPVHSSCTSDGLCRLDEPDKAPIFPSEVAEREKYIFHCNFTDRTSNSDCDMTLSGPQSWYSVERITGTVLTATLQAGQNTTLFFGTMIEPSSSFCLVVVTRHGPSVAGQLDSSSFSAQIVQPPFEPPWTVKIGFPGELFGPNKLNLYHTKSKFSVTFSVPIGVPDQYVELKDMYAYNGQCT